jgi:hypothetical protein
MSEEATAKVLDLAPRLTQRRLRVIAFARVFAETMDTAQAFRDVYRPAENPLPTDKTNGDRLIRTKAAQKAVADFLKPHLVALGVDQTFALRRLLETIDGDITDYVKVVPSQDGKDVADLMSLKDMREALPLAKRRLVRKYKVTYDQFGQVKTREIELEPKQPALELLAKIKGWVTPGTQVNINGDDMLRMIEAARKAAPLRADEMRTIYAESRTIGQLNRPKNLLPAPEAPKDETVKSDGNKT